MMTMIICSSFFFYKSKGNLGQGYATFLGNGFENFVPKKCGLVQIFVSCIPLAGKLSTYSSRCDQ
jgi:hypothetical protein